MQSKLRSIYDALDEGNYKQVLHITKNKKDIDKYPLAKVLRAVALQRSEKSEEAMVTENLSLALHINTYT